MSLLNKKQQEELQKHCNYDIRGRLIINIPSGVFPQEILDSLPRFICSGYNMKKEDQGSWLRMNFKRYSPFENGGNK